ncbi:MAG: hypothetical protein J7484_14495, partial [Microbacterium sp.]|nr:hypothetical protein [Microbacterium sp.]
MLGMTVACAAAVGMISWIPHLIVIHDGYLPTFTHEKNTPFTFWFLVITLSVCAALLALAPAFPLTAGQSFTDDGVTFHRGSRSTPIALWIAAPPIWAASALLFYRIGRGLWRRFHPESPRQSDPALRAIEALVPPLRGRLTLTEVQREERAQRARERRSAREKRPQGSLNLPGLVQVPLYLSTLFLGMILPQILMSAWPPNVRFPLAGLVFLAFG